MELIMNAMGQLFLEGAVNRPFENAVKVVPLRSREALGFQGTR